MAKRFTYEPQDLEAFRAGLTAIAETLGGRTPGSGSLKVWFAALQEEVPAWAAITAVNNWVRYHAKTPVPAEIIREARELKERSDQRRQAEENTPSMSSLISRADPAVFEAIRRMSGGNAKLPDRGDVREWVHAGWLMRFARGRHLHPLQLAAVFKDYGTPPTAEKIAEVRAKRLAQLTAERQNRHRFLTEIGAARRDVRAGRVKPIDMTMPFALFVKHAAEAQREAVKTSNPVKTLPAMPSIVRTMPIAGRRGTDTAFPEQKRERAPETVTATLTGRSEPNPEIELFEAQFDPERDIEEPEADFPPFEPFHTEEEPL